MAEKEHAGSYPTRCLHMAMDAETYSGRSIQPQYAIQQRIKTVFDRAAEALGFARESMWLQPQGDGALVRFPNGIDEAVVVAGLMRELRIELEAANRELVPAARVRLRLAFHVGLSQDAALGLAGDPPVAVTRLANSSTLKARLKEDRTASLVVIVPDTLFQELVVPRLRGLDPAEWDPVRVSDPAKNFVCEAWMTTARGSGAASPRSRRGVRERLDAERKTTEPTEHPAAVPAGAKPDTSVIGRIDEVGKLTIFNDRVDIANGDFTIN